MARRLLSRSEIMAVELCGCGNVYLTVGPVCISLQEGALYELRTVLEQSLAALALQTTPPKVLPTGHACDDGGEEVAAPARGPDGVN